MKRFSKEYHDNKVKKLLGDRIVMNPAFRIQTEEEPGIVYITENPEFNKRFQQLIVAGLENGRADLPGALKELQDDFQQASMYMYNIMKYGRRGVFMEYMLGLPTILNVPYKYRDITNFLVEITGEEGIRELDVDHVDFFYWAHVEYSIHTLLKEHGLKPMDSLKILKS